MPAGARGLVARPGVRDSLSRASVRPIARGFVNVEIVVEGAESLEAYASIPIAYQIAEVPDPDSLGCIQRFRMRSSSSGTSAWVSDSPLP